MKISLNSRLLRIFMFGIIFMILVNRASSQKLGKYGILKEIFYFARTGSMAPGEAPGHEDWLVKEVEESQSSETITKTTLSILKQTSDICKKLDPITAMKMKKDCEDVRNTTIKALMCERENTKACLDEIKTDLSQAEKDKLSDGSIDAIELDGIQKEYRELQEKGKEIIAKKESIQALGDTLEEKGLHLKYGAIVDLLHGENIDSEFVNTVLEEIQQTGKISLKTLEMIKQKVVSSVEIEEIQLQETQAQISDGFEKGNMREVGETIRSELGFAPETAIIMIEALDLYLQKNPDKNSEFLAKYSKDFFGGCMPEISLYMEIIYLKVENQIVENMNTFLSQHIGKEKIKKLQPQIEELIETIKEEGCTIEQFKLMNDFFSAHIPGIDMSITQEIAVGIIGDVIKIQKTHSQMKLLNIRDTIQAAIGGEYSEILTILESKDEDSIRELLGKIKNTSLKEHITGELTEVSDDMRFLEKQEKNFAEISSVAGVVMQMNETERARFTKLYTSAGTASEKIDIHNPVDLVYIQLNVKDRLCLIDDPKVFLKFVQENDFKINVPDVNAEVFRSPEALKYVLGFGENALLNLPSFVFQNPKLCTAIASIGEIHHRELFRQMLVVGKSSAEDIAEFIKTHSGKGSTQLMNRVEALKNIPRSIEKDVMVLLGVPKREEHIESNPIGAAKEEITKLREMIARGKSASEINIQKSDVLYAIEKYSIPLAIIGDDLKLLIDTNTSSKLLGSIFQYADVGDSQDIGLIKYFIQKSPENFSSLPRNVQQNSEILYNFGKLGKKSLDSIPAGLFETGEQFGNFFAGYTESDSPDYLAVRKSEKFGNIAKRFIGINNSELSGKAKGGIENYKEYTGGIESVVQKSTDNVEIMRESQKKVNIQVEVGNMLEGLDIGTDTIDLIVPLLESEADGFFQGLYDQLEAQGLSQEDIRNTVIEVSKQIKELYEAKAREAQADAESLDGVKENDIQIVKDLGYFEDGKFSLKAVEEDFNTYLREIGEIDIETIYSAEFITEFLIDKGIPESKHKSIREFFRKAYRAKIEGQREQNLKKAENTEDLKALIEAGTTEVAKATVLEDIMNGGSIFPPEKIDSGDTGTQAAKTKSPELSKNSDTKNTVTQSSNGTFELKGIALTIEEAKSMKGNQEAIDNFINTDTFFEKKGLPSAWRDYRHEIVGAMNMRGSEIQIDLNDDSLGEQELLKFSQFIFNIINGNQKIPTDKIEELGNQLLGYSGVGIKDRSGLGDRFITELNDIGINKNLGTAEISEKLFKLANGIGLTAEVLGQKNSPT